MIPNLNSLTTPDNAASPSGHFFPAAACRGRGQGVLSITNAGRSLKWLSVAAIATMLLWLGAAPAGAQYNFDPANYSALNPATSSETIPVGTRITRDNWTN
jgi:hypothetical protein